jgi:16S rRNA (uracil1498-N3)-methyltransferase
MTAHRFFIKQSQITPDKMVKIEGPDVRHIRLVLRLKKGGKIQLVDDRRNVHLASVEMVSSRAVLARIVESTESTRSHIPLTLVQGLPRLPKADLITRQLSELGVDDIVFVPMEHTTYSNGFEKLSKRLDRLRKIAEAAAKQCGRHDVPNVSACADLEEAAGIPGPGALLVFADENVTGGDRRSALEDARINRAIGVFIGPEGGLSDRERRLLQNKGAKRFSLGRNILRTETAAVVAAAMVLYELGEL